MTNADIERGKQGERSSVFEVDSAARLLSETHGVTGVDSVSFLAHQPTSQANQRVSQFVERSPGWQGYVLDGRGNWVETETDEGSYETLLNPSDEYLSYQGTEAQYHARGSLVNLGDESYEWDSFGELRCATAGSQSRDYVRDALGRIVGERASDGSLTWFGYGGMH